jgi:hypothetical protein
MFYIVSLSPSSQPFCTLLDYDALNNLLICMVFPLLVPLGSILIAWKRAKTQIGIEFE